MADVKELTVGGTTYKIKDEVCRTNILYVADQIGKNLSPMASGSLDRTGTTQYCWIDSERFDLKAGIYVVSVQEYSNTSSSNYIQVTIVTSSSNITNTMTKDTKYVTMTVPNDVTGVWLRIYGGANSEDCKGKSMSFTGCMLCTKEAWNISHAYEPYALPNYDLTRLEAEDRASLAEVVDSGAKNLFDNSNGSAQTNLIWDSASGTATQGDTNDAKTNLALKLQCRSSSSGSWTEIFSNRLVVANGVISIPFTCPINASEFQFGHNGSTKDATMLIKCSISSGTQCVIQCNVLNYLQASGKYSWNKIMICTKAAFGVSQKFTPYRVPITGKYAVFKKSISCSTTLTSTGIKFVSDKTAYYRVSVTAHYGNSKPLGVTVKQKVNSSATPHAFLVAENDLVAAISVSGMMQLGVGGEFEVFAKYETAASNDFYMLVEELG